MSDIRKHIDIVRRGERLDEIHLGDIPGMASKIYAAWSFLKQHGIPMMMFAAVVALHGFANAIEATQQGEVKFNRIATASLKRLNREKIDRVTEKLNTWFTRFVGKLDLDDPLEIGSSVAPIIQDFAESRRR